MPISNQEEAQILGTWWKEYRYYIVFPILALVLITVGWRYWQRLQVNQQEHALILYMQMLHSEEKQQYPEVKLYGEQLLKEYARSIYASFGALFLAKEAVRVGDWQLAVEKLKFVINHAPNNKVRQIARLRAARVLIAAKQPEQALEILAKVDDLTYNTAVNEVKGDALLAMGKAYEAEQAYHHAEQDTAASKQVSSSPLLKAKLQQF